MFVISSVRICLNQICDKNNTTGATSGAEMFTFPEHLSSPPVFCGVRVGRSLAFCLVFSRLLFAFLSFYLQLLITPVVSFGHYITCPSIYSFLLPLWYLLVIILPVLLFTASYYTPVVSFCHYITCLSFYFLITDPCINMFTVINKQL